MLDKLSSIEENHFSEYFWRQVLGDCRSNSVYLAHFASVCLWSRMNEFMSPPCFFSVAALLGPFTSPTFRKEPFPLPLSFLSLWRWSLQPLRFRNKQTSRVFKTLTDLNVISRCNFIHLKRPWARQPLSPGWNIQNLLYKYANVFAYFQPAFISIKGCKASCGSHPGGSWTRLRVCTDC